MKISISVHNLFRTTITGLFSFLALSLFCQAAAATVITDHDGLKHEIIQPFTRIISLYPAHTENLAEMGALKSLIGISSSDDYPSSVLHIKRYSYHDSIEKFISAQPDCILIRPMIRNSARNLIEKMQQFGITVISLQPTTVKELYDYWEILGLIAGVEKGAAAMTQSFQQQLKTVSLMVQAIPHRDRPHVYFESIHSRMKTFSPDSITMFCLISAGGLNVATDAVARRNTNIAGYSKERILAHAANIDVFLAQEGRMNRISYEEIMREPGFGAIKAIKDNRVYLVDETLVSRPTTRLIDGIKLINQLLYSPEDPHQTKENS